MTGKQVSSRKGMIMIKIRDNRGLFGGEAVTVMQVIFACTHKKISF
ncbi:MAG: hypothetical protein JXA44_05660 [Methanospirillaceae archaeon]|nr:hypothetical protein [Methanospirillaceae archaeon]